MNTLYYLQEEAHKPYKYRRYIANKKEIISKILESTPQLNNDGPIIVEKNNKFQY